MTGCRECGVELVAGDNWAPCLVRRNRRTCRRCNAAYARAVNVTHRERVNERNRKRYAANPEPIKAANRAWRAANPEKLRAAVYRWKAANPAKVAQYAAKKRRGRK